MSAASEINEFQKRFLLLCASIAGLIAVLLWLLGHREIAVGLLFGSLVSMLSFWAHGRVLLKASSLTPWRAKVYVFFNFLCRYFLYFLALAAALQRSPSHFWGAAAGLLVPRLVVFIFYTLRPRELAAAFKKNTCSNRQ